MFVFQVEGQKQSRTFMSKNKYQRTFAQYLNNLLLFVCGLRPFSRCCSNLLILAFPYRETFLNFILLTVLVCVTLSRWALFVEFFGLDVCIDTSRFCYSIHFLSKNIFSYLPQYTREVVLADLISILDVIPFALYIRELLPIFRNCETLIQ